jgi:transglutaminase-like putative cysteine protease
MIEALRSLGFAARFVSGYIYSPGRAHHQGGGATHAWVQVYLPGCGWIEMDPTNGIFGNRDLIRVAVARDHKQAAPLTGSFTGPRGAYQGMSISVSVEEQASGVSAA